MRAAKVRLPNLLSLCCTVRFQRAAAARCPSGSVFSGFPKRLSGDGWNSPLRADATESTGLFPPFRPVSVKA